MDGDMTNPDRPKVYLAPAMYAAAERQGVDMSEYGVLRPIPGFVSDDGPLTSGCKDGAEVPLHHHPHEQAGMLIKGQVQLTIGDETRICEAGSLFIIPPNVPHRAVAVNGPAVVLDVFSPVREDYAELANRYIPPVKANG